jgi:NAD(P)-dependent dehydrogenase (short-subunit alcohol dehydrogenase family)
MMKTWLITGTSSGLGRLLAERLLQRGDRVVATLRREGALDDLKMSPTSARCTRMSLLRSKRWAVSTWS